MEYDFDNYTGDDINVIKWQLKTNTVEISTVLERCSFGYPSIIMLYPLCENEDPETSLNYRSVSALIWLTCPYLNGKIHEIEDQGTIERIQGFIKEDRELMTSMKDAHAHFYYLRKRVFHHYEGEISTIQCNDDLFNTGIGGIKEIEQLKCLHLQYAHYRICDKNIAGYIVYKILEERIYCEEGMCRHSSS